MNAKARLLQFIDYLQITPHAFTKEIGVSSSFFYNESAIGSDKLHKISSMHPQLDMNWVISGVGEMLNTAPAAPKEKDWKAEYEKVNQKYTDLLEKYMAAMENMTAGGVAVVSNKS